MKEQIEFSEFLEIEKKLEIRIGKIVEGENVPKSDKLLKLTVDFGELGLKTCVTNLGQYHGPQVFQDTMLPFIMNLKPSKMMGVESEVMIMVADLDGIVEFGMDEFSIGSKLL